MSFLTEPITIQSLFGPKRKIDTITVQVVVNENTSDNLTITKQPVQQGSTITDHAYKEPVVFSTLILFKDNSLTALASPLSNTGLSKIYESLRTLQSERRPLSITTPKRIYTNMLIAGLGMTTEKSTENCLSISATFQEVIIVKASTTAVPRSRQRNPGKTGATEKAGQKSSAALTGAQAGNPNIQGFSKP